MLHGPNVAKYKHM